MGEDISLMSIAHVLLANVLRMCCDQRLASSSDLPFLGGSFLYSSASPSTRFICLSNAINLRKAKSLGVSCSYLVLAPAPLGKPAESIQHRHTSIKRKV
jgi:hypothetical protein